MSRVKFSTFAGVVLAVLLSAACTTGQTATTKEVVDSRHPEVVVANGVSYRVDCELFVRYPAALGAIEGVASFKGQPVDWMYLDGYDDLLVAVDGAPCGRSGEWAVGGVEGYPYPCEFSDDPACER